MKGFLSWFKSSTKLKRWLFVILVGIALTCYGVSRIIVTEEMKFIDVGVITAAFVIGFIMIILGLVYIQKRTLEILIEADVKSELVDIQSLIFNKNVYDKGPNVVVIGGGTGLNTVLQGVKKYTSNITAIVNVSDGEKLLLNSREEVDVLRAEDVKDSFIALASDEVVMDKLLNYRFDVDYLKGISFGDIYLSAMKDIYGDLADSVEASGKVLNITGRVLPVTLDRVNISAELKNGSIIENRKKIADAVWDKVSPIQRIYVTPSNSRPAPGVLEAIRNADCIIIGPGSLYTNILPNLLIKGVAKEIKESKAIKVYVSNIMTEPGQTDDYNVSDHIKAIEEHVGKGLFEFCICDMGEIAPEFIRRYNMQGSDVVSEDTSRLRNMGIKIIKRDLAVVKGDYIRHDADTLASIIIELICNDLKFRDKQNDPLYMVLNSKQNETKKIEKQKEKAKNYINKEYKKQLEQRSRAKTKSKFSKKYNDRINAIKTSEENRKENIKLYETSVDLYESKFLKEEMAAKKSSSNSVKNKTTGLMQKRTVKPKEAEKSKDIKNARKVVKKPNGKRMK